MFCDTNNDPPQIEINKLKKLLNNGENLLAYNNAYSIINKYPNSFIIWNILGVSLFELGKIEEAIQSYKKAIKIKNNYIHSHINLSLAYRSQGKLDKAIETCKKAALQNPNNALTFNCLGTLLSEQGNLRKAIQAFNRAISLEPEFPDAYNNLGAIQRDLDYFDEAIKSFKKAIAINPSYVEAHDNLGLTLADKGRFCDAIKSFKKAIMINPNYAEAYNDMGVTLANQGKFDEGIKYSKKAISIKPNYAEAYINIGNIFKEQGNFDFAIASYKKGIDTRTVYAEAYYNLSLIYNLKGNFQKGLDLYEWRLKKKKPDAKLPRKHLIWDGKVSILDKKFFVYEEQGLGDVIQFCRYLPLLKQKGAEVIFKVKPKMHTLLKTIDSDIIFVDRDCNVNNINFEAPLMSLPYLLNTTLKSIPFMTPYLSADNSRIISWKKRLSKDRFKVGICWQGSKAKIDFGRSFQLTLFKDISKLSNVELISLHKGEGEKQIEDINFDLTVLGNDFDNGEDAFVDTAAVISNCDLIITSDTAIAHLAGALGCPTWVVLKKIPDWRWMLDRNDSPWYPSMKLYRQKEQDNWEDVFKTIKKDLLSFIKLNEN